MIALGVQLVFNGHGAGDAADIQVGVHGAVVRAAADLAESHGVDVLVGGILKNIRGVGVGHIHKDVKAQIDDCVHLIVHRAQVGGERRAVSREPVAERIQLIHRAAQIGEKAVQRVLIAVAEGIEGEAAARVEIFDETARFARRRVKAGGGVAQRVECLLNIVVRLGRGVLEKVGEDGGDFCHVRRDLRHYAHGVRERGKGVGEESAHRVGIPCLAAVKVFLQIVDSGIQAVRRSLELGAVCLDASAGRAELRAVSSVQRQILVALAERVDGVARVLLRCLERLENVGQRVRHGLGAVGQLIDAADVFVDEVDRLTGERIGVVHCGIGIGGDRIESGGNVIVRAVHIVQRGGNKSVELIQFRAQPGDQVVTQREMEIGLHLTDDAAHILAAVDHAVVGAEIHKAVAAARAAADVVAEVRVADRAAVDAGEQAAGGVAGDAAGIRGGVPAFHCADGNKVGEGGGGVDAQIVKTERGIDIGGVHAGGVDARAQRAEVIAGDAAGVAIGGDAAAHRAVGDQPARLIAADDAANGALTLHNAEKRAFLDRTVAASGNAADKFLRAAGRDLPLDLERVDEGAALEREEKTGGGERVSQRQTADGVPAAVEGAAEAGDGLEVHTAQGDVGGQKDRLAARPGVIGAAVRKGAQVLRRVDVDDAVLPGGKRGQGQGKAQHERQGEREQAGRELIRFHRLRLLPRPCCRK